MSESKPDTLHRAFELDIHIGGDTWDDVMRNFRELADHIPEHGPSCNSVSGSPSCGHTVTVRHRPEMTHEKYIEDLEAWIARRDGKRGAQSPAESRAPSSDPPAASALGLDDSGGGA